MQYIKKSILNNEIKIIPTTNTKIHTNIELSTNFIISLYSQIHTNTRANTLYFPKKISQKN